MRRNKSEPVEGSGLVFTVAGTGSVLDAFVGTFLAQQFPASAIQRTCDDTLPAGNVRVDVWPQQRWMLLSSAPNGDRHYIEALSQGASAVFSLAAPLDEFQAALKALLGDRAPYVPNELMRWLANSSLQRGLAPAGDMPRLTPRELEVLRLVTEGYTNAEIAAGLSISTNTVRTHLHALSVKLDAPNRARLIARARSFGLVGDDSPNGSSGLSELSA